MNIFNPMQISIIPPRISLLMLMYRLAVMPMQRPIALNKVEQRPMMPDAVSTACSVAFCRQAKDIPTASASKLVATDSITMLAGVSIFAVEVLSFCLMPSHSIFIPR